MGGFREFLVKTNALALAVGVIIGVALGAVVNSLVNDVIMPPVGLALGGIDFSRLKVVLKAATGGDPTTEVAIRYGTFITTVLAFIVIAIVVYWISNALIKEPERRRRRRARLARSRTRSTRPVAGPARARSDRRRTGPSRSWATRGSAGARRRLPLTSAAGARPAF